MKDKIVDVYFQLREKYFRTNLHTFHDDMKVVLRISPKAYAELRIEANEMVHYLNTDFIEHIDFFYLCGEKVPVIIEDSLPDNVEFIIQYRRDYERLEKERLMERFRKMFGGYYD